MNKARHDTRRYRYSPLTRYTRNLLRKVNRGIDGKKLIADGDRVLVAVSGGKDSLSLLHLLLEHRRFYPFDYDIGAVHVSTDFAESRGETREYLRGLFERLGVGGSFLDITVTVGEDGCPREPDCFWCSWRRRQALFDHCVANGFTRLAFGHHADDVAETTLLNLFYHGTLETMLPKRSFFDGRFELIRPLFHVRERELVRFAKLAGFSSSTCSCSHAGDGKRQLMKQLVRDMSLEARQLHSNLWRAADLWHGAFGDHPLHPRERDDR